MAQKRSATLTIDGKERATKADFTEDGRPKRPLHLKRDDSRASTIEGEPTFRSGGVEAPSRRRR